MEIVGISVCGRKTRLKYDDYKECTFYAKIQIGRKKQTRETNTSSKK